MNGSGKRLEYVCAFAAILWGLWVVNPFWNTFDPTKSSVFRSMSEVAPEWVWGLVILLIGILQFVSRRTMNIKFRSISSFLAMFVWITLSIFYLMGNYASPGISMYVIYTAMNYIVFLYAIHDGKVAKL
jgi:nitrate reductase gamma subunit